MFISLDADGNESAASISRALGMFQDGQRLRVDRISDWMIETMQDIAIKLNKAERKFIPITDVRIDEEEYWARL